MSHFPTMFKGVKGKLRSWLLQVNDHDQLVVYSLDEDGKIDNMAAGKLSDVIMSPIKTMYKYCILDIITGPEHPDCWGFRVRRQTGWATWESVRQSLLGKASLERRDNRRVFDRWQYHGLADYLSGRYWGKHPNLKLTALAETADSERRAVGAQEEGRTEP